MVHSRRHRQSWAMCTPRHIERRNPGTMLSKVDSGFRRAMLQRHSLSPFLDDGGRTMGDGRNNPNDWARSANKPELSTVMLSCDRCNSDPRCCVRGSFRLFESPKCNRQDTQWVADDDSLSIQYSLRDLSNNLGRSLTSRCNACSPGVSDVGRKLST